MTCLIVEGVETLDTRQRYVPRYSFCTPRPMKLFAKYRYTSDRQFVADLLVNDERALECLLYDRFRRLLRFNAMKAAPNVPVDDLVQEFTIEDQELLKAGTTQMTHIMMDIQQGLAKLEPPRDREILTALILRDEEPQTVADRFHVTVDNLYNIKRRALAKLIQKHLKDYAN